jgi:antitoxin component YwqK of YwqJK toxin-antitoxin module
VPVVPTVESAAVEPNAAELPTAASEPLHAAPRNTSSGLSKVPIIDLTTIAATKQEVPSEAKALDGVTELVREYYASGAVKLEREVVRKHDGSFVSQGVFRQFDEQGTLLCEGTNEQGQPVGIWKRYYAANHAPLFATSPYKDFAEPFTSQASFSKGQIHGKWTITDAKQRKVSEIDFIGGQRHGTATWFYPQGKLLLQASFDRGRVHGDVMKWEQDSSLLGKESFINGCKLALKEEYHDNQHKRSEVFYLQAPLVVTTPDDFHTATLATFERRGQDEKFGAFRVWHANGQLARQGEYRHNLPVGKFTWFYANGQKQMEGTYVDGKQEGRWTWWHQNGMRQIAGDYRDGVAHGKWQWWDEDGKLAKTSDLSAARVANLPSSSADSKAGSR